MADDVSVAVTRQATLARKLDAPEDEPPVGIIAEGVDIEAHAHPHRHGLTLGVCLQAPAMKARATSRSCWVVILVLASSPGTTTTRPPMASTRAASSPASGSPSWARRSR